MTSIPLCRFVWQSACHSICMATLVSILTLTSGCTTLVRPNFTQELIELRSGQYQLDPAHSYLIFRVEHLGLSKIVGRFNELDATLDFDPQNPTTLKLEGTVNTNSIDVNNPDLEDTLNDSSWLSSKAFPQIIFQSQSVEQTGATGFEITGTLSMRGVSQPVTLSAVFNGGADNLITRKYTIGFSATTTVNRSSFGIDSFSAFVGDDVEVELHGEFLKQ